MAFIVHLYTEIFSKRRKIYPICIDVMPVEETFKPVLLYTAASPRLIMGHFFDAPLWTKFRLEEHTYDIVLN